MSSEAASGHRNFWTAVPWRPEKTIAGVMAKLIINSVPEECPDLGCQTNLMFTLDELNPGSQIIILA